MPIRPSSFVLGETLYATDINTYLTNGGIDYVATASATSGTALNVNNCFSATYVNYLVMVTDCRAATTDTLCMRLRVSGADATGALYYNAGMYCNYAAGGTGAGVNGGGAVTRWDLGGVLHANGCGMMFYVNSPQLVQPTTFTAYGIDTRTSAGGGAGARVYSGVHNSSTSYTGFTLFGNASVTLTNITLTVYGMRIS